MWSSRTMFVTTLTTRETAKNSDGRAKPRCTLSCRYHRPAAAESPSEYSRAETRPCESIEGLSHSYGEAAPAGSA
jgi:hypothetical protein